MKKKFSLEIKSPCNENVADMIPNTSGFFCNSCAKNVIDLSTKTNSEVAKFISDTKDKNNICARLHVSQLGQEFQYNELSKSNNLKYAVAVAATVLLTSNITAQEKEPIKTEIGCVKSNPHILGKVAYNQTVEKTISITVNGKLLDSKTNKPLDAKLYPNLVLTINGSQSTLKLDPKTGAFSIPIAITESSKELMISIYNNDYFLSKMLSFNVKSIKKGILTQNIVIDPNELSKMKIAGGLGVIEIPNKTIKKQS